jgi:hypothetical protein
MISIDNYISERLILSKNKKLGINDDFNIYDSSYTGKVQLSNNSKLEFHRIFNKKYKLVCCTETWVEGINDDIIVIIVKPEDYDNLSQYFSDDDNEWEFERVDSVNNELYDSITSLLGKAQNIFIATYDKWLETRKRLLIPQLNTNQTKIFNAFTEHIEKDLR